MEDHEWPIEFRMALKEYLEKGGSIWKIFGDTSEYSEKNPALVRPDKKDAITSLSSK